MKDKLKQHVETKPPPLSMWQRMKYVAISICSVELDLSLEQDSPTEQDPSVQHEPSVEKDPHIEEDTSVGKLVYLR